MHRWSLLGTPLIAASTAVTYELLHDYSGSIFFEGWNFYGSFDNSTWGNVTWVTQEVATSQNLAYVTSDDHVVLKVDNVTNVSLGKLRNSVRIITKAAYDLGSLWIIDLNHIPYGCSVWPAFWSNGPVWPDGEGCYHTSNVSQLGSTGWTDCSQSPGCTVEETSPNSYGAGFAKVGGGVFATQFDVSGIFIWFWSRPNVPSSISRATANSSMNVSTWGTPHASFSSNQCNISQFFTAQNLVLDIDLCGIWARVPSIYDSQCVIEGPTGQCYNDCVVGPGSPRYDDAYFDINYVRTYTTTTGTPSAPTSGGSGSLANGTRHPPHGTGGVGVRAGRRVVSLTLVWMFLGR